MKTMAWAGLAAAAMMLSGCIRESRIALPSDLAVTSETLELTGMGLGRRGDFLLAGTEGRFTRGADQLSFHNAFLVRNSGAGSFSYAGLEGACRYRENAINVGPVSVDARPFAYRCFFGKDGAPVGELVIEEETGTVGSMLSKRGRRGFLLFDGVRYEVTSIHRDQNGSLAAATPLGYRFEADGRAVGAVDLNGTNKTLFAPRDRRAREAVFAGGLALSVLWDPAVINP
ncbi:hypothetical protein [Sphingomonas sp. LHG3443-2]|uniref:hypothetical protein n=1 Tax=Sphingomonas sp. LHG3443-2 TaxID=2804639 RepID=UPI003CE80541